MGAAFRKIGIVVATAIAIGGITFTVPNVADARGGHHGGGGHWGGGHWGGGGYWGGGWGWGGLALGSYYGGYYPYGYYDDSYAYAGDCYIRRQWVINRYGHRVLRRVQVCY